MLVYRDIYQQRQTGINRIFIFYQPFGKQNTLKISGRIGQRKKSIFGSRFAEAFLKTVDTAGQLGADCISGFNPLHNLDTVFNPELIHAQTVAVQRVSRKIKPDRFRLIAQFFQLRPVRRIGKLDFGLQFLAAEQ